MPTKRRADVAVGGPRRTGRPRKDARPPGAPTTKELILLSAAESFASRGFDGASLVDIAEAAGVTTGAVYSHFRGKPELLLTVVSSTLDAVHPARRDDAGESPAYLHEWVDWLIAPEQTSLRALIAEIHHAAMRDPEVRERLSTYGREYSAMIAAMIERWQAEGIVRADRDPRSVAGLFLTQALGLCSTAPLRPGLLIDPNFVEIFHRQLSALLGEPSSER